MLSGQLRDAGVTDPRIIAAFEAVPREDFAPSALAEIAYADAPLPIDPGETLTPPRVIASMVQALELQPLDRALEVGSGSGYSTAILSRLANRVVAVERHRSLVRSARDRHDWLGCLNTEFHEGDGALGWAGAAPFDAIIVWASAADIPAPLMAQLAIGGRLVIPVGPVHEQDVLRVVRLADGRYEQRRLGRVSFAPLAALGAEG